MAKGLRLLGHPVHAALSHFPLALLAIAPLADAAAWLLAVENLWHVGFWCLVGGVVAAIPTAVSGLFDFAALETDSPAAGSATWHMMAMFTAVSLSAAGLILRRGTVPEGDSPVLILVLEGLGAAAVLAGGWLGGELVYGHGVGLREQERR